MKIIVGDDHPLYREVIRTHIEHLLPEAIVVEIGSLADFEHMNRESPGIYKLFLLDYYMPGMSTNAIRELVHNFPATPIAIISVNLDRARIHAVIQAGAHGFIPKTANRTYLLHALQLLLAGGTSVPVDALLPEKSNRETPERPTTGEPPELATLTSREHDVMRSVMRGLSNKQIARELGLAEVTVKLHLHSIFRKIGVRSRSEMVVVAVKAGIS